MLVGDFLRRYCPPSAQLETFSVARLAKVDPKGIRKGLHLNKQHFSKIFGIPVSIIKQAEKPGAKLNELVMLIYSWINYDPGQMAELHGQSQKWYAEAGQSSQEYQIAGQWFDKLNNPSSGMYQLTHAQEGGGNRSSRPKVAMHPARKAGISEEEKLLEDYRFIRKHIQEMDESIN